MNLSLISAGFAILFIIYLLDHKSKRLKYYIMIGITIFITSQLYSGWRYNQSQKEFYQINLKHATETRSKLSYIAKDMYKEMENNLKNIKKKHNTQYTLLGGIILLMLGLTLIMKKRNKRKKLVNC